MANWKSLIQEKCESNGETIDQIVCTLSESEMLREFNDGYGGSEGMPFTAWSENYVYFPVVYDGAEWCGSAPRHPCDKATNHQGGE